jgi:hypothetical protein
VEDIPNQATLRDIFHCYYQYIYWDLPVIDMRVFGPLLEPEDTGELEIDLFIMDAVTLLALPYISRPTLLCLSYESRWSAEKGLTDKVKVGLTSTHEFTAKRLY